MNYKDLIIIKYLKSLNKKAKLNMKLQSVYNSEEEHHKVLEILQQYNLTQPTCFLASGQSSYFNEQIDLNVFSNIKIDNETISDCKYISSLFGKNVTIADNDLSILYTTLLGTTEFNYAMQTFSAGIMEDVFQCSSDHSFPIQPVVGESEENFYVRLLNYNIKQSNSFPLDKRKEALLRAKRIAHKFCLGNNRVYLIPFDDVLNNKASFGDIDGLRDEKSDNPTLLATLPTFLDLLKQDYIIDEENAINPYSDPNMKSEFGLAIYGNIISNSISYIEVERMFTLMQKKASKLGLSVGDVIPNDILYKSIETLKSL